MQTETNLQVVRQEMIELRYNRKHIDKKIKDVIVNTPEYADMVEHGVELLEDWLKQDFYESKNARLEEVREMDLKEVVTEVLIGLSYFTKEQLYVNAASQISFRLGFNDRVVAVKTTAEIIAVLYGTYAFDLIKESRLASIKIKSLITLPDSLIEFMERSSYLPPMVCEPLEITHNYSSGYLTHNDSVITGSGNHHDGNVCLDVINKVNKVAMTLNVEFLKLIEEENNSELVTQDQVDNWEIFVQQSKEFEIMMIQNGNRIYFNHKVDTRGRIYCQGYHINYQGTAFKKACLDFADQEEVTGVF